ncbi:MAG: C40 family peptidase [Rubrivivax sp.]
MAPPGPLAQRLRDGASNLVLASMDFLGVPYRRGGASADDGFDCSGFTRYVFERTVGLVLPRRADEQARDDSLVAVARDQLKPGDLVFFNTMRRAFSHVGIYVGDGRFIHAPRSGSQVRIDDLRQTYWSRRFDGARRADGRLGMVLPSAMPAEAAPSGDAHRPPASAIESFGLGIRP